MYTTCTAEAFGLLWNSTFLMGRKILGSIPRDMLAFHFIGDDRFRRELSHVSDFQPIDVG